jgi:iron(III) transport system permease protein
LLIAASGVAALVVIPLVYVLLRAAAASAETWQRLWQTRLVGLLANTLGLMGAVTLGTLLLGVSLAWLVERTDLPGRKAWRWLLALPLAVPAFIGAVVHVALLRPRGGLLPQFVANSLGWELPLPSPFGFWGAAFMLTLFMYPYVYLLSAAAFRSLHASLEEAAHALGRTTWQTLWEVTLPVLRPGLTAGVLLVALDVLAEYGTVALLRYETFSAAIFRQLSGRYDRSAAAILSGALVLLALAVLAGEIWAQGRSRYEQVSGNWRPAPPLPLRAWCSPAGRCRGCWRPPQSPRSIASRRRGCLDICGTVCGAQAWPPCWRSPFPCPSRIWWCATRAWRHAPSRICARWGMPCRASSSR